MLRYELAKEATKRYWEENVGGISENPNAFGWLADLSGAVATPLVFGWYLLAAQSHKHKGEEQFVKSISMGDSRATLTLQNGATISIPTEKSLEKLLGK